MRKVLNFVVMGLLIVSVLSGCNQKVPDWVGNKGFYLDMVKCLELTENALRYKNLKYADKIEDLVIKHTEKDFFKIVFSNNTVDSKPHKNVYDLNEKEQELLVDVVLLDSDLKQYINAYFKDNYNVNVMIDTETIYGKSLLKSIQETISLMEIEHKFENEIK